jgi:ABC-type transport system involved in multi-copper enzyme maturation permease subunit
MQSWLALVLASWVAPRLMGFDLADNALPILLSHPISRFGYVLGKFIALFGSLSWSHGFPCDDAVCRSELLVAGSLGRR